MHRPGMKALLAAVAAGRVDIVYADAMDRLSRSQADIATLFDLLRFRGILLATRKEGVVTPLHIGMIGTINAEQLSATSDKTRDALVRRHAMAKNPGGSAYGYEKRIEHDGNGERIRGLQQIVPNEAAVVVRIFEDYAAGLSPVAITRRLNADGVASPRSGKASRHPLGKAAAWTPNTLTGNAARGTFILNNPLYVGRGHTANRRTARTRKRESATPSSTRWTSDPMTSRPRRSASYPSNCGTGSNPARLRCREGRNRVPRWLACPSSRSSARGIC